MPSDRPRTGGRVVVQHRCEFNGISVKSEVTFLIYAIDIDTVTERVTQVTGRVIRESSRRHSMLAAGSAAVRRLAAMMAQEEGDAAKEREAAFLEEERERAAAAQTAAKERGIDPKTKKQIKYLSAQMLSSRRIR